MTTSKKQINLRLPESVKEQIALSARFHHRTFTEDVTARLRESLAGSGEEPIEGIRSPSQHLDRYVPTALETERLNELLDAARYILGGNRTVLGRSAEDVVPSGRDASLRTLVWPEVVRGTHPVADYSKWVLMTFQRMLHASGWHADIYRRQWVNKSTHSIETEDLITIAFQPVF